MFDSAKFIEREAARGADAMRLYVRFGHLPPGEVSLNSTGWRYSPDGIQFGAPHYEAGVAVFRAIPVWPGTFDLEPNPTCFFDPVSKSTIITDFRCLGFKQEDAAALWEIGRVSLDEMLGRPAFLVTGSETKRPGAGGEPCLTGVIALACIDLQINGLVTLSARPIPGAFYAESDEIKERIQSRKESERK